jgi:hypothetical protein
MSLRFRKSSSMGAQHSSKPVLESDKHMSERHKSNRKNVDTMTELSEEEKLNESNEYNKHHAEEHIEAIKKNNRLLSNKKQKQTVDHLLRHLRDK